MKTRILQFIWVLLFTNIVFGQNTIHVQNRLETISKTYWIAYNDYKFGGYQISETSHMNTSHVKTNYKGLRVSVITDIDSLSFNLNPYYTLTCIFLIIEFNIRISILKRIALCLFQLRPKSRSIFKRNGVLDTVFIQAI